MTTADRARNAVALMTAFGITPTAEGLLKHAAKYEKAYRRARSSKRPPAPHLLAGMLSTARAFYSLARTASR